MGGVGACWKLEEGVSEENLSDGEIWIEELKETQKSLKKMYIDKNDK